MKEELFACVDCEHRMRVFLPQRPDVWRGRQCRVPKTHLQSRQPQTVQDPCTRVPHSLRGRNPALVQPARASHPAPHHTNAPTPVPPSRSSLHPPVPQVVLAVAASEMGGAHAEATQHTSAAVHTATLGRECTYEGRLGVSWELSELSARRGHEIATGRQ